MISFQWKAWVARLCFIAFTVNGTHDAKAAPLDLGKPFVFPWGTNTDATDVPKVHVQRITEGTQKYSVVQGGTMDARNCRTPMGVGMNSEGAFFQTWESSRSVRMENASWRRGPC